MPELTTAGFILFAFIAVEMALFFVMNGADFGAGMAAFFVRKDERHCDDIMRVPWPVWFGNETWYVVAMGTMFGAFPHWYANMASGWYLLFIVTLACLILRGMGFDFRMKWQKRQLNKMWDVAMLVGSSLPPFLIGIIFSSALSGVPIVDGVVRAGFFDIITPFSVVSGIVVVLFCLLVGLSRVVKFLEEGCALCNQLRLHLRRIQLVLLGALVVETVLPFVYTDVLSRHPAVTILLLLFCLASVVVSYVLTAKDRTHLTFWFSSAAVASFVLLLFWGLYPNAIVGATGSESLTIAATAAGPVSQNWALGGTLIMFPVLVVGQGIAYYFINKHYAVPDTDINY